jgi:hypothetical protein
MFCGVGGTRREEVSVVGLTMTQWRQRSDESHRKYMDRQSIG